MVRLQRGESIGVASGAGDDVTCYVCWGSFFVFPKGLSASQLMLGLPQLTHERV